MNCVRIGSVLNKALRINGCSSESQVQGFMGATPICYRDLPPEAKGTSLHPIFVHLSAREDAATQNSYTPKGSPK
jgi:hypothetical protein